ncbi:MAG: CDP-2,3-bis-(O-geranylgeranyl)-sn-glycerol synthase [Methanotrichaceae archaeon]|nr:CDP-2,3-bis-(O-geranylgeranyl)-sn-glycerol synthase [Methanotrichaceae archaeon]
MIGLVSLLLNSFWLMLPAYLPNNCAVIFGGGRPLDFGKNYGDGRRILGDGKTFRGTIGGTISGILAGLLLNLIAPHLGLPTFGSGFGQIPILVGLSFGAMLGDITAAFLKRRLGLKRGDKFPVLDQLDFVFGAWILTYLLAPVWFKENFTLPVMIAVLIITPLLHRITNIIGYRIGTKKEPW